MPLDNDLDSPLCVNYFEHTVTRDLINYDPRLLLEELRRRSVVLEGIKLT